MPRKTQPITECPSAHAYLRLRQIEDATTHGLRHWFASAAAAMGYNELVIAGLLGRRVKSVTVRYATVPDSSLLIADDHVAARIWRES